MIPFHNRRSSTGTHGSVQKCSSCLLIGLQCYSVDAADRDWHASFAAASADGFKCVCTQGSKAIKRPSPAIPVSVRAEHIIIVGGINVHTRRIYGFDPDPAVRLFEVSWDEFLQTHRPVAIWLMGQK